MARALMASGALIACAACMTAPDVPLPPVQARIADANARAAAQLRAGNEAGAVVHYEEALELARSIEDADAIAAGAINLSIVYQRLGRDAQAREVLSAVLEGGSLEYSGRRHAQAALRRAILDLAARDASGAASWAQRAHERCEPQACDLRAAILNVQAQIALDAGRPQEAVRLASMARAAAQALDDRAESANALRTAGRAHLALGNAAAAVPPLEAALALDRELADPRKILADLVELGAASAATGNRDAARAYFERALAVSRAAHDARSAADVGARLRSLDKR